MITNIITFSVLAAAVYGIYRIVKWICHFIKRRGIVTFLALVGGIALAVVVVNFAGHRIYNVVADAISPYVNAIGGIVAGVVFFYILIFGGGNRKETAHEKFMKEMEENTNWAIWRDNNEKNGW